MKRRVDYDCIAEGFDERYRVHDYEGVERALRDFAAPIEGVSALEIGCGTGHWLALLAAGGARVAGLDASAEMLARGRELLPGVELVHGRAESLPWPDGSFDRIFAINALHHFDDKPGAIAEARRTLRSGGALMVAGLDPHNGADRWWIYNFFEGALERDRARYPSTERICAWMSDAGLIEPRTTIAMHVPGRHEARDAIARGLLGKSTTSQLTILSDEEYQAGMSKLEAAIERAEAAGEAFHVEANLRVYTTIGRLGGSQ